MPRLFLAFELPEHVKDELIRLQDLLRPQFETVLRLTPRDNLHLTLKFIGQTTEDQFSRLRDALPKLVNEATPSPLRLSNSGAYPPRGAPKVVWIGSNEHSGLAFCHHRVETVCSSLDFERDIRGFSPHITIARAHDAGRCGRALRAASETLPVRPCELPLSELSLFRSHTSPGGSVYQLIERVRIGANFSII